MLKVESDILNFKAACSRARRRAKSLNIPVYIRRNQEERWRWEVAYDDGRDRDEIERDLREQEEQRALYESLWEIQEIEREFDFSHYTARVKSDEELYGSQRYTSPSFAKDHGPEYADDDAEFEQ